MHIEWHLPEHFSIHIPSSKCAVCVLCLLCLPHLCCPEPPLCQLLQLVPAPHQVAHKVAVKAGLLERLVSAQVKCKPAGQGRIDFTVKRVLL